MCPLAFAYDLLLIKVMIYFSPNNLEAAALSLMFVFCFLHASVTKSINMALVGQAWIYFKIDSKLNKLRRIHKCKVLFACTDFALWNDQMGTTGRMIKQDKHVWVHGGLLALFQLLIIFCLRFFILLWYNIK